MMIMMANNKASDDMVHPFNEDDNTGVVPGSQSDDTGTSPSGA